MTEEISTTLDHVCHHFSDKYDTNDKWKLYDILLLLLLLIIIIIITRKYRFLLSVCSRGHRSYRYSNQCTHPLRPGGLKTAQKARAHCQSECSGCFRQFLSDHNLFSNAVQHSPHRVYWLLAVHIATQWKLELVWNYRVDNQPCNH